MTNKFDTVIQNARVFNNGENPVTEDIAIKDGLIVKRGQALDVSDTKKEGSRCYRPMGHARYV